MVEISKHAEIVLAHYDGSNHVGTLALPMSEWSLHKVLSLCIDKF